MLNKLKTALEQIRYAREQELLERKRILGGCGFREDEYQKAKAILTLELPFRTNIEDVLEARASLYLQKQDRKEKKQEKTADTIITEWCNQEYESSTNSRTSFCELLQSRGILIRSLTISEIARKLPLQLMIEIIEKEPLKDSTKEVYTLYAKDLYEFLQKDLYISTNWFTKKDIISLFDVEKLFEYLEKRALKGNTIRAFEDVFLSRALFYAPVTTKKLFSISSLDRNTLDINCEDHSFPVPRSFVDLWNNFLLPSHQLFPNEMNERVLHQKIRRLGEYAEVSLALTPSILRSSMESICYNYLFIEPEVIRLLPRRS